MAEHNQNAKFAMSKITLASRVRQQPAVLKLFLDRIIQSGADDYLFVEDNDVPASSAMLLDFAASHRTTILPAPSRAGEYVRHETMHVWDLGSCRRAASLYNKLIDAVLADPEASAVFFIDSDVLVPNGIVTHLHSRAVPIACEVYWTQWQTNYVFLPQVWDIHPCLFQNADSVIRLREPGLYRVNGQGACTLVRREVLAAGVRFDEIPGIPWEMEDRWFCVRAAVAGFSQWADTTMTPFHVYRDSQLDEARAWIENGCRPDYFREHWLTPAWEQSIRIGLRSTERRAP